MWPGYDLKVIEEQIYVPIDISVPALEYSKHMPITCILIDNTKKRTILPHETLQFKIKSD